VLQEGSGGTRALNEDYTYFLNGEMYNVSRGGSVNLYMMSFHLMGARDGDLVWESAPYEVKQVR